MAPTLDIVVPCFNESAALPEARRQLEALLLDMVNAGEVGDRSRLILVDDGSADDTWRLISRYARESTRVAGIRLSRNFGHQMALLAGLAASRSDAVITIDADLQDDIAVIRTMVARFRDGFEVVYGVRRDRGADSAAKRGSAVGYYRLLAWLGVQVVHNHADFRLLSRRAVAALAEFPESNVYLRGLIPLLGFRTCSVEYDRRARRAGETKYSLRKMLSLALTGITSLSPVPLRLVAALGFLVFVATFGMIGWVLWIRFFTDQAVPGWASSVIPIYFLGGVQLLSLGVLGEYVARIYLETKRRPRFIVAETAGEPGTPAA